jgi:hypothetical protein
MVYDGKRIIDEDKYSMKDLTEVWRKIESRLEILLGDYQAKGNTWDIDKLLICNGVKQEEIVSMSLTHKLKKGSEILRKKPTPFDSTIAALDLLLGERFGFTPEQLDNMTDKEIFEALDHAMGYDADGKPSIWEISK